MSPPAMSDWLILSAALFSLGLYGLLTCRNAIRIMMSLELMLNSTVLNLVVFNRYLAPGQVDGKIMGLFIIAVAAAEVVIGMGLFVSLFSYQKNLDVTQMDQLRE